MLNNTSTLAINATTTSCTALTNVSSEMTTGSSSSAWLVLLFLGFYISYIILREARSRKAFSAIPGLFADHGLVTSRLFIETETGHIFGSPPDGTWMIPRRVSMQTGPSSIMRNCRSSLFPLPGMPSKRTMNCGRPSTPRLRTFPGSMWTILRRSLQLPRSSRSS